MTQERVALITGSSRGIGAACARALAKSGFKIALHHSTPNSEDEIKTVSAGIPGSQIFCANLSDRTSPEKLVKSVKEKMGRIDVLVNNAGVVSDQLITFAKPEDFETVFQINVQAVFLLAKTVSRLMIKQKQGSIINITSVVGHMGNGGQSIYGASKSAVTGMTQSMALDLAGFGIRCNCVAPGFIETDMTKNLPEQVKTNLLQQIPLKRMGAAHEVASAVRFLASEESSYITGTTIHVNGGIYRG